MAAGVAAMGEVLDSDSLSALNARGDHLRENLNGLCRQAGVPIHFTGMGSLLGVHGTHGPVNSVRDLGDADDRLLELLFLDLLENGFYMARRGFIALMLTVTDEQLEGFSDAFREFLRLRAGVLGGSSAR